MFVLSYVCLSHLCPVLRLSLSYVCSVLPLSLSYVCSAPRLSCPTFVQVPKNQHKIFGTVKNWVDYLPLAVVVVAAAHGGGGGRQVQGQVRVQVPDSQRGSAQMQHQVPEG